MNLFNSRIFSYLYTMHKLDLSDYFIMAFIAIVFISGAITVFRFMRNKK